MVGGPSSQVVRSDGTGTVSTGVFALEPPTMGKDCERFRRNREHALRQFERLPPSTVGAYLLERHEQRA